MEKVGYNVVYDATYGDTQSDFTQNVIAMKNAGVKVLFIDQMAEVYASALLKDLVQQNFHPLVVLGRGHLLDRADPGRRRAGRGQRLLLRPERLALPRRGRGLDPGGGAPSSTGSMWPRPGSTPTCSPSTGGCRRSSSSRL